MGDRDAIVLHVRLRWRLEIWPRTHLPTSMFCPLHGWSSVEFITVCVLFVWPPATILYSWLELARHAQEFHAFDLDFFCIFETFFLLKKYIKKIFLFFLY